METGRSSDFLERFRGKMQKIKKEGVSELVKET